MMIGANGDLVTGIHAAILTDTGAADPDVPSADQPKLLWTLVMLITKY